MEELAIIGKRLKEFLDSKRMKINELGKLSGTSGTQIYNIVKGKKYGVDKFISVMRQLPDLNVYWLINGEGSMLRTTAPAIPAASGLNKSDEQLVLRKEIENLKSLLAYQEMTVNAYKRSLDMAAATNEDLKKLVELYRELCETKDISKKIKSA